MAETNRQKIIYTFIMVLEMRYGPTFTQMIPKNINKVNEKKLC